MIRAPILLGAAFVVLVLLIQRAAQVRWLRWAFAATPVPFWCYLLPMIGTAAGIWPAESPLYVWLSQQLLPICLILLLLGADLRAIARLSRQALGVMAAGSLGIVLGMVTAAGIWHRWLPSNGWQALGALAGSWTGGSMNLLAVKEALRAPDAAIAPIIVVDTIVAYGWMALLLGLSSRGRARPGVVAGTEPSPGKIPWHPGTLGAAVTIAVLVAAAAQAVGRSLPAAPGVSAATWTILLVTTTTLILSATPAGTLGRDPTVARLGLTSLFVLLASIGARANLQAFRQAPAFLAAGVTAVMIHGLILLIVGRRFRLPLGLLATASQANVGGVVSAPLVAAAYDRGLAPIGLLMAVFGNVIGTYAGLVTAALCRLIT